jgi:hypothetical protein
MAKLLMNLRNVPDDESGEVRALLDSHRIDYYETMPSKWGLSGACIWLRDERQYDEAKGLLAEYQEERANRARAEHAERRRRGEADTWFTVFMSNPVRFAIYVVAIVAMFYLALLPVVLLNR